MVAQGFSPGEEMYKYGNPDERRGGIMPMLQCLASLFRLRAHALRRDRVPPHHPVGFGLFFSLFPRVSFALLTPHRGYYMPPRHAARLLI